MSGIKVLMIIGGSATAITSIVLLLNRFFKFVQSVTRFMDDWYGTEEFPGVVERLAEGNARFDKIEEEIATVKAELFNNHGTSLRDAIDRIENAVIKKK
jgi:uncharacterized protein YdcH (DUF465 family)